MTNERGASCRADSSVPRLIGIVLLGWLAQVGFDLFQHAGIFAQLWLESQSTFLPPTELFRRIPLGYLSFLVSTVFLAWLMLQLKIVGSKAGALFGIKIGSFLSASMVLGMASGFPIKFPLLVAWFFGGIAQYAVVAAVLGSGLGGARLGRLSLKVIGLVIMLFVITIILQTLGIAPAMTQIK